jgi:hypothetical protein
VTAQDLDDVVDQHERQQHPRRSVYVTARLTSNDHAEDCEILNVSVGGAKIRVAADSKLSDMVALTIGTHGSFPAKVAWRKETLVGLEFMGDREESSRLIWDLVENPEVDKERRRCTRTSVLWSAHLHTGGRATSCRLVNISAFGAKIRLFQPMTVETRISLRVERFGVFPCDVVWKEGDFLGISFRDDPEDIIQIFGDALPAIRD